MLFFNKYNKRYENKLQSLMFFQFIFHLHLKLKPPDLRPADYSNCSFAFIFSMTKVQSLINNNYSHFRIIKPLKNINP